MGDLSGTLYFNAPGFRSDSVEIAPAIDPLKTKRKPLIEKEDQELDQNLVELDEGTRARNRAFQERLDEIWRSTYAFNAKLKVESQEAVESILHMKDEYDQHLQDFITSLKKEINDIFDVFDKKTLPTESALVDVINSNLEVFIKETVPATIEAQSGEVCRQLKRAYETFDIEKKKEEKREIKLVNRAAKHIQKTAQRFEDESAFISSCFNTLDDDIVEHERRAARLHNAHYHYATEAIVAARIVAEKESHIRQVEDGDVLDTVIETQKILQKMVIDHFGSKSDEIELQHFPKLEDRMEKINSKRKPST